jgi:hypothetical protein
VTQQNQVPFDEQAALAELEKLQAAIQSARRQRLQANDQFDTFVRKIRETRVGEPPVLVRAGERSRSAAADAAAAVSPGTPPLAPVLRGAETAAAGSEAEPPVFAPARAHDEAPGTIAFQPAAGSARPAWWRPAAAAASVLALVLLAFLFLRGGDDAPVEQAGAPAPATTPSQAAAPAQAPPPVAAAPQPDAPVQIRLETIRPSWMRVIVDGEKVAEREFPAGQELRYSASREINVRAGDGGAVRVSVRGGQPSIFGKDGFPLTRTFRPAER